MNKSRPRALLVAALVIVGLTTLVSAQNDAAGAALAPTRTPRPTRTIAGTRTPRPTRTATTTPKSTDTPTLSAATATEVPTNTPAAFATDEPTDTPELTDNVNVSDEGLGPAVAVTPGPMTSTVLLYNASSVTANAVLHIYDASGNEIYTSSNIAIPANGAQTLAMPASVPTSFIGSAKVTSDNPVLALVMNANGSNTARDTYESGGGPASYLTFPVFRNLGSAAQRSLIAVHNPDPVNPTSITFHFYNSNGSEAAGSPISGNLQPLASAYFDSMLIFNTATFTYTVHIDSTSNVAGAEQVLFTKDTASVRGLTAADEGTQLYLDWIERKGSSNKAITNWSEIYVQNRGGTATNVTLTFYTSAGAVKTSQTLTIQPNGYGLFNTKTLTKLALAFAGFAKVTQTGSAPLAAEWLEVNAGGNQFYAFNAVPSAQYALNWACGNVRRFTKAPTQYTIFKIVNVDSVTAKLSVKLFDPSTGLQKAVKTYTLGAGKQLSVATSGMTFSGVGTKYGGLGLVQSAGARIVVTAYTTYGTYGVTAYTCSNLP